MKRAFFPAALLAASLVFAACENNTENVSKYDPALDGPTVPASPTLANPLLEGKSGAADTSKPVSARPALTPATSPAGGADVDAAKSEIDARVAQMKQYLADEKWEEFERAGNTPDEWKAKIAKDPQAFQNQVAKDKADAAAQRKTTDMIIDLLKGAKPALSADGSLATYHFTPGTDAPPAMVFKKVDGTWYASEDETMKAIMSLMGATPATKP